ncbi:MAG: FHA domain-containing protein [Anaeromyxobacter sp.]|nr:FHA domain-containing protein [Anaeromyxobacter sp.]MBL0276798.1 FHA domain-containing protein [Anaeromyxobacter sp.]
MSKPVKCARCGRENDPSFAFCLDCGQPLKPAAPPPGPAAPEAFCTACGTRLQAGFKFCGHCGTPVAPRPPTPAPAPPATGRARPATGGGLAPARPAGEPAAAASAAPRLATVRHDGLPGAVFPLDREQTWCGRAEGEIRLADDPAVSPRHARFTRRGAAVVVEDLGSVNGTYLRLKAPHRLGVGEELRLGRQLLRLEPVPRPAAADERGVRPWGSPDGGATLRLSQLLDGGGLGEIFPLRDGENTLGREAGDVTFPGDRYVSARHARLDLADGVITLTDLGSSNGTFVRVAGAVELAPGDQLLLGTQLLRLDA